MDETVENLEVVRENGLRIVSINDEGDSFRVKVETPDKDTSYRSFKFAKDNGWMDTTEYVEDGEFVEDYRWKVHIENKLEREFGTRIESAASGDSTVDELSEMFEGERLS